MMTAEHTWIQLADPDGSPAMHTHAEPHSRSQTPALMINIGLGQWGGKEESGLPKKEVKEEESGLHTQRVKSGSSQNAIDVHSAQPRYCHNARCIQHGKVCGIRFPVLRLW
jgi:hypothetical protein